jgi:hypothetical protein
MIHIDYIRNVASSGHIYKYFNINQLSHKTFANGHIYLILMNKVLVSCGHHADKKELQLLKYHINNGNINFNKLFQGRSL